MTQTLKYSLISAKEMLLSAGPLALIAALLIAFAFWKLNPTPPKQVSLATGPAQSAYEEFGKRYAHQLRANGVEVKLVPSEGSQANLALLKERKVDLAFVQGGSLEAGTVDDYELESLGSLFVEPVWLFYRDESARRAGRGKDGRLDSLAQLRARRINIGAAGSGVPNLMTRLLDVNHIDSKTLSLSTLDQTPAVVALLAGDLDAVVFASAPEAPMVQMLLQTPGIRLLDFPQSEAYSRRFEFLTPVVLPRGVVDLAANVPTHNVRLIASTTTLLAQDDTHPAVLQLFSAAAKSLHGGAGWFNKAREFPKATVGDFPMAPEAERYIQNGAPLLHRFLPFWLANLIERMWLALGIILAVLIPLSKIVPPLYQFRIRRRVFRWYAKLRDIEQRLETQPDQKQALLTELNELEQVVSKINVPLSYTDEQYSLLANIGLVRKKMSRT
ncbi:MAG: ABC transporter substrate-binding protein [Betaproteobacteria bacterium]|nr:ABC transporter substrate-binding protein [Betaproteobacteria bacterium]